MIVQVYGITTVEDAAAVDRLGVDHIGLVVDEGIDTWDRVDEETARAIARSVGRARLVALSLSTDVGRITATAALIDPPIVHLARAHEMSTTTLARVREQLAPRELMLTVPVTSSAAVATALRLAPVADVLLLDSKDPSTGVVGATGLVHDWDVSAQIARVVGVPVILAGGIGPDNVVEAITRVRPAGVDSETRTSRDDDRRRKDLGRVETFLERARNTPVT